MAKRVYLVGLDGMMSTMYKRFAAEGMLPNLKRLADEGVMSEAYTSLPAWTPTNWATLMTGAHVGTHTVSRWFLNMPNPRNAQRTLSGLIGPAVAAETIFEVAAKRGLRSVAIHYPASAPSRTALAHTVDGYGHSPHGQNPFEIAPFWGYTNIEHITNASQVRLRKAEGWMNTPNTHSHPLEFRIDIVTKVESQDQTLLGLVVDTQGKGYDEVIICASRDGRTEVARAHVGQWSNWVRRKFRGQEKEKEGTLRFKTVELAPDGSRLRLYRSQVMAVDDFCEPPELGSELVEKFGPYVEHEFLLPYVWGIADLSTWLEEADYHWQWIAKTAKYLVEERGYSLLYTHIHTFDNVNHYYLAKVDPACPGYEPAKAEEAWDVYRQTYKIADRLVGTLMEGAPQETTVIVVSDHAAFPQFRATSIYQLLCDKGYLVLKDPAKGCDSPGEIAWNIDMTRTKVFVTPVRNFELFVNAPEGTAEYKRIQEEVITLLRTWVDKETGQCPVAIALPKKHAQLLGFWGEQCGDIVFFMEDGYSSGYPSARAKGSNDPYVWKPAEYAAHHGPYLPTARTDIASNAAFFLGWGPGLKKGYERPANRLGYMHLTSVVPLICHLLGIEPPDQCQGSVPRDFLEGTRPVMERLSDLPTWEPGTRAETASSRVWTQKEPDKCEL